MLPTKTDTGTALRVTTTWHNAGPHTVWGKLAARLGREPTNNEAADEVRRILTQAKGRQP